MIWLFWSFTAAILFAICNEGISEITEAKGPLCLFYFAPGAILIGLIYHIIMCIWNRYGNKD
jgi:hypothetical protein